MKIAILGQFEWYGCMGVWVADAFKANGHKVDLYDRREIVVNVEDYDLLIAVDCSEDYSSHIPSCKKIVKVFWSMDAHMPGGEERSVNMAQKCDITFSSNYEYGVEILKRNGIESYLLPVTYSDKLTTRIKRYNLDNTKNKNIVMIGHPNSPERLELWKMLKHYDAYCGKVDTSEEYTNLMRGTKVVINQPTEPWDIILNNRFFEALSFGKKLFQKRLKTKIIEKLGFVEKRDFVYWDNLNDLRIKLDKYFEGYDVCSFDRKLVERVKPYSMKNQAKKLEDIVISKFYHRFK